jgi:hypothetical protein
MAGAIAAEGGAWDAPTEALSAPVEITVYRSPSCGCCGKWIEHVKRQGFVVKDMMEEDMDALKQRLGLPEKLKSCHTAVVGDYLVEGHVPAGDIKRLLRSKAKLAGIAVPGMPVGTSGMDVGGRKDAFSVLGFWKDGRTTVFSDYRSY